MLQVVFNAFDISENINDAIPFGNGLINRTWKINRGGKTFILQQINNKVFKDPEAIAYNINVTGNYLRKNFPSYLFVMPVPTVNNGDIFFDKNAGYYRLLPFVENSHTIDVVQDPQMAYEAAKQFGRFTKLLSGFDANSLKITLPDFHNLSFRYQQFEDAIAHGDASRIEKSRCWIDAVFNNKCIVDEFERIKINPQV